MADILIKLYVMFLSQNRFPTNFDIRETLRHQHGQGCLRRVRQPIRGRLFVRLDQSNLAQGRQVLESVASRLDCRRFPQEQRGHPYKKSRYNVECHGIVLQSQVICAQKACYNSFMKCKKQLVDIEPQVCKKKFLTHSWNNLAVNFYPETGCL